MIEDLEQIARSLRPQASKGEMINTGAPSGVKSFKAKLMEINRRRLIKRGELE
jgi:hypothetical protein